MARRWPLGLGLGVGLVALWAGLQMGADTVEGWRLAARWTARVGFPLFILTYAASSLGRLFPSEVTRTIWRERRWWGLGFAACHTVHLVALLTFLELSGETRPPTVLVVAGGGYAIMYLMVLTSNERAMRALGRNWKRLHRLGIHWLWFVFFVSYLGRVMEPGKMTEGHIGTAIALGALGLRIAAWRQSRQAATAMAA